MLPKPYNNTFSGFGPKEAEFIARLSYENKRVVTIQEMTSSIENSSFTY
jgi:hypothetical protein